MAKIELNDLNSANSTPAGLELVNDMEVKDLTETDMSSVVGGIELTPYIAEIALKSVAASLKDLSIE